uniref:Uncharacterized protein n=1 Tax=Arundo donax TaxID=35708 RepID=A0A0A9CVU2_ARUDO
MTPNSAGLAPVGHVTTMLAAFPRISHSVTTAAPSPSTTLQGGASAATPLAAPTPPCARAALVSSFPSTGSSAASLPLYDPLRTASRTSTSSGPSFETRVLAAARARWAGTALCAAARRAPEGWR